MIPDPKSSTEVGTEFFIATETYGCRDCRRILSHSGSGSLYSKFVFIVNFQVRNHTLIVEH